MLLTPCMRFIMEVCIFKINLSFKNKNKILRGSFGDASKVRSFSEVKYCQQTVFPTIKQNGLTMC